MPLEFILAVDQGTTNTKAVLVDRSGRSVFQTAESLTLMHPQAGFVEQDADGIWNSVRKVMLECVAHVQRVDGHVMGIAISNQRETAVAWRRGNELVAYGHAVSWQCRRSTEIVDRMSDRHEAIRDITGLPVDPLATAGKWTWMLKHDEALRAAVPRGEVCFGNVDAWLLANLTGGKVHATDHSNASRTALFDLAQLDWSEDMLEAFEIPRSVLPKVHSSASVFGICTSIQGLEGVPIVAMIGDSHAALFGHGSYVASAVKATYGTGSSLMMLTGSLPGPGTSLARTIAWSREEHGVTFALEGNIAMTGSSVAWVGEFLGLPEPVSGTVALAASVTDAAGLVFVPGMVGLGAPYWDTRTRGLMANLERFHKAAHLARAAVDSIAFQVADVLFAMEDTSRTAIPELRVDGGATRNDALMQFQADIIQRPVLRSSNELLSALGAAWLGGFTLGWWTSLDQVEALTQGGDRFEPRMARAYAESRHDEWKLAVSRARLLKPMGEAA
jgi:glycerol kinase